MKVAVKTRWRNNVGLSFGEATSPMVAAKIKEDAATVPTARCLEVPKTA